MATTDYLPVSDLTALDDVSQSDQMVVQVAGDNGDVMLVPFSTLIDKILDKLYARSESPAFTGSPTAPTPVKTDGTTVDTTESSTRIATTEYVQAVSSEITQAVSDETERAQNAETSALSNFAGSEDTTTASSGYAVGDYLLLNKKLYVVTATIVSGDRLVEGTNISSVQIGSKFKTIDASLSNLSDGLEFETVNVASNLKSNSNIGIASAVLIRCPLLKIATLTIRIKYDTAISLSAGQQKTITVTGFKPVDTIFCSGPYQGLVGQWTNNTIYYWFESAKSNFKVDERLYFPFFVYAES